jgi:drug/metabolite transporter (DMT)-like permease
MFAAVLTTFCFAASAILARRSVSMVGSQPANLARQFAALVMLGLWAHLVGQGLRGPGLPVFIFSGILGFGMGDFSLFEALPRLGAALTVLIVQCLAVPIGAVTEWLWLGTRMTPWQMASSSVILAGVAIAIAPERESAIPRGHRIAGVIFAVLGAFGQAWGAVVSRQGFLLDRDSGIAMDGASSAYQRLIGGIICVALLAWTSRIVRRWRNPDAARPQRPWARAMPWIVGNAFAGPALGVTFYQWALSESASHPREMPTAIVLSIVATTPLAVMALSFVFEKTRPSFRAVVGSLIAVIGVVATVRSWYP